MEDGSCAQQLDILLSGPQLQAELTGGQSAYHVEQQTGWQQDLSRPGNLGTQWHSQPDLGVGCKQLRARVAGKDHDSG